MSTDLLAADVVVLGSGAAGLSAALEAADHGAATIVLERERETGGSSRLSGGYVALCETALEPGTGDELLADLVVAHNEDADLGLSRRYVEGAPEAFGRLRDLGVEFVRTKQFAYMSRPWAHELPTGELGGGAQIVRALEAAARARGVRIQTGTRARRLRVDDSGRVTGVVMEEIAGRSSLVSAGAAVVVTTGGFTRNRHLIRTFGRPGTEQLFPITGPGSEGDGLIMAMAVGAAASYLGVGIAPTAPVEPSSGKGHLPIYSGGIMINRQGERFCNESTSYVDISWAGLGQPGALMFQIYDEAIADDYKRSMLGQVMSGGRTFQAASLEALMAELGAEHGLDVDQAVGTVMTYNEYVDQGEDPDYGRRHLLETTGDLVRIETPPFHAVVTVPGTTHFNGGLRIDDRMRVLDWFDEPVPGLYAAGEVTGGFHGTGYLSGSSMGMSLIFGGQAGREAAAGAERHTA